MKPITPDAPPIVAARKTYLAARAAHDVALIAYHAAPHTEGR